MLNDCGHDDSAWRRALLLAAASAGETVSNRVAHTRASHPGALCIQSLAADVSSSRRGKAFFGSLDHAALAALAPDEREDHRTRDRHGLEPVSGLAEIATGLEHLAQQMIRRAEADRARSATRSSAMIIGRSHGWLVRRQSGAWLIAAANRPGADAVSVPA